MTGAPDRRAGEISGPERRVLRGYEDGRVRVAPEDARGALAGALDGAAEFGLSSFVVGPPPAGDDAQHERIAQLTRAFADECAARGAPFVPTLGAPRADGAWTAEAAAGDGAHPAAGGYAALARLVLDGGWLSRLTASRWAASSRARSYARTHLRIALSETPYRRPTAT